MNNKIENLIIIGSGPAGHSAGIYAGRAKLNPLLFEGLMAGGVAAGGQLTTTTEVENYAGFPNGITGPKLMENMRQQSLKCGVRIETKTVSKVDLSVKPFLIYVDGDVYQTHSIIIATGSTAKRMRVPKEEQFWQNGISACAVCDGALPIFRNKVLVVIGGGDTACEEAHFLTKFAKKVYLVHRRNELRASKTMQDRVKESSKIEILWNTELIDVDGEQVLTKVILKNNETQETFDLDTSGLFYAIGHTPNTQFLEETGINLDESKYLVTHGKSTKTSIEGVFAAGDVQDKIYRQAITSAGTGCMSALEVEHYLAEKKII